MANSVDDGGFYPGQDLSASQLLHAARKKMQGIMLGKRYVSSPSTRTKSLMIRTEFSGTAMSLNQDEVNGDEEAECAGATADTSLCS